jgi:hypothetical protein
MGIHFYSTSPSPPSEQAGRLKPASHLLKAGICSIVYAEDALSIIHRVPTTRALFDHHLLFQKSDLQKAVKCLCSAPLSYELCLEDETRHWKDYLFINPDTPYAFRLNEDTYLLTHNGPPRATKNVCSCTLNYLTVIAIFWQNEPLRIFLHSSSVFHFDMDDDTKTCLNPSPPSQYESVTQIQFPTLPAFYDSLIDTIAAPPLPFIHHHFHLILVGFISYLSLYTLSDEGLTYYSSDDSETATPRDRTLLPQCIKVLEQVRYENRPYLIRHFLAVRPLAFPDMTMERHYLKKELLGDQYTIPDPPFPWHPNDRGQGKESDQRGTIPVE